MDIESQLFSSRVSDDTEQFQDQPIDVTPSSIDQGVEDIFLFMCSLCMTCMFSPLFHFCRLIGLLIENLLEIKSQSVRPVKPFSKHLIKMYHSSFHFSIDHFLLRFIVFI